MSWFRALFSADKVADNVLDKDNGLLAKAGGWIGNMNFTEEERAEMNKKFQDLALEKLKALAPFKVMQRILVTIIASTWATGFFFMLCFIAFDSKTRIDNLYAFMQTEYAWTPMFGVVVLYLLGGVVPSKKG